MNNCPWNLQPTGTVHVFRDRTLSACSPWLHDGNAIAKSHLWSAVRVCLCTVPEAIPWQLRPFSSRQQLDLIIYSGFKFHLRSANGSKWPSASWSFLVPDSSAVAIMKKARLAKIQLVTLSFFVNRDSHSVVIDGLKPKVIAGL